MIDSFASTIGRIHALRTLLASHFRGANMEVKR